MLGIWKLYDRNRKLYEIANMWSNSSNVCMIMVNVWSCAQVFWLVCFLCMFISFSRKGKKDHQHIDVSVKRLFTLCLYKNSTNTITLGKPLLCGSSSSGQSTYELQLNPIDHWACAEGEGGNACYDDKAVKHHSHVNGFRSWRNREN